MTKDSRQTTESATHEDQDRLHPAAESAAPNVPHAPVYARDSRSVGGHHGVAGSVVGKPGGSGESGRTPVLHPNLHGHHAFPPANVDTAPNPRTIVEPIESAATNRSSLGSDVNWDNVPFGSQWPSATNSEFQNFGDRTLLTQAAETAHRPTPSE